MIGSGSRDDTHARALRAAAKVALTMSTAAVFSGCQRETGGDPVVAKADPATKGAAAPSPSTAPSPVTIEKTSCLTGDGKNPTATEVDCCTAKVKKAFPDGSTAAQPNEDAKKQFEPSLVACCAMVIDGFMEPSHSMGLTFGQARACCGTQGVPWWQAQGMACTPWGPPMPIEIS